ncbi:MAG: GIY-YIG nuclease family protein [bacterium]|nr:GIY-YIG nuclease family protein [bacterium]
MEGRCYYVYINTNKSNKVIYTGVTNNLLNRIFQHKNKENKNSFTAKYNVNKLVYYEVFNDINNAISREKQIKNLVRRKKIEMIDKFNSGWKDLGSALLE